MNRSTSVTAEHLAGARRHAFDEPAQDAPSTSAGPRAASKRVFRALRPRGAAITGSSSVAHHAVARRGPAAVSSARVGADPPHDDRASRRMRPSPGARRCRGPPASPRPGMPRAARRASLGLRQADGDRRALADRAGEVDRPAVALDDAVDHRQAEAGALLLRREERVEHLGQVLGRDARAGVGERQLPAWSPSSGAAATRSAPPPFIASHALMMMLTNACRSWPKSPCTGRHRSASRARASTFCSLAWLRHQRRAPPRRRRSTSSVGERERPLAREVEQVADDRRAALGLALDEREVLHGACAFCGSSAAPGSSVRMSSFA